MQIRLVDLLLVDEDVSVEVDVDPVAGVSDHPLDEDVVVIVESYDITRLEARSLERHDEFTAVQRAVHRLAVDPQDRDDQCGEQDDDRRHDDQDVRRAQDRSPESRPVGHLFIGLADLLG